MTAPTITTADAGTNLMTGTGYVDDLVNSKMDSRWLLNGNANDSIGSINGTPNTSINYGSGIWGTGVEFNDNEWIDFGDVYDQTTFQIFSCGAIVKAPSTKTVTSMVISKAQIEPISTNWLGYNLCIRGSDGKIYLIAGDGGGFNLVLGVGTTDLRDDQWHSIGMAWDSSNCRLYVDGILENTISIASLGDISNSYAFRINANNTNDFSKELEVAEAFFEDDLTWSASDYLNWHNQLRHTVDGTNTSVQVNSSTEAESL